MTVRVEISPQAQDDVFEYGEFIAERDPAAADRFLNAFATSAKRLGEHPAIGSPRFQGISALRDVRAWPVRGYEQFVIYYRASGSVVQILRVLRGSVPPEAVLRTPD